MRIVHQTEDELTPQIGGGDIQMDQPDADVDSKYKDITGSLKRQARNKSKQRFWLLQVNSVY